MLTESHRLNADGLPVTDLLWRGERATWIRYLPAADGATIGSFTPTAQGQEDGATFTPCDEAVGAVQAWLDGHGLLTERSTVQGFPYLKAERGGLYFDPNYDPATREVANTILWVPVGDAPIWKGGAAKEVKPAKEVKRPASTLTRRPFSIPTWNGRRYPQYGTSVEAEIGKIVIYYHAKVFVEMAPKQVNILPTGARREEGLRLQHLAAVLPLGFDVTQTFGLWRLRVQPGFIASNPAGDIAGAGEELLLGQPITIETCELS
jgi:hypothetical protein